MKRCVAIILALTLVFLASSNSLPLQAAAAESSPVCFSMVAENGDVIYYEIYKNLNTITTLLYVNNILSQESIGYLSEDTIITRYYDNSSASYATSECSISDILSISSSSNLGDSNAEISPLYPEYGTNAVVPTPDPGGGNQNFPDRNVLDEPRDNIGLIYSHLSNGRDYYYLGNATVYNTEATLFRSYSYRYIGDTHFFTWGSGTASAVVATALAIIFPAEFLAYAVSVIVGYAIEVLMYTTSVQVATYEHDYYYQVKKSGEVIFDTYRFYTYWHLNQEIQQNGSVVYKTDYVEKSFDGGFSPNNLEMINHAVLNYG